MTHFLAELWLKSGTTTAKTTTTCCVGSFPYDLSKSFSCIMIFPRTLVFLACENTLVRKKL
jgi:hypothetical protein